MAFGYLVSAVQQGTSAGSGNTSAIDTTGANLIVINVSGGVTPTDSKSNTWTSLTATTNSQLWYCYNPTVGSGHTFAANGASSFASISVAAFSGSAASPFDVQHGGTGSTGTASLNIGNITPSQDNELLVMGLGNFAPVGGSTAIDVGAVLQSANFNSGVSYGNALAYQIQTTATLRSPNWSWATNTAGATSSVEATFKAAAAAGFVPYTPWPQLGPTLAQ